VRIPDSRLVLSLDALHQLPGPRGWPAVRRHRAASAARSIAGEERLSNLRKELDVPWQRLPRGARRAAKDPGCLGGCKKDPVVGGIPDPKGSLHLGDRWKRFHA